MTAAAFDLHLCLAGDGGTGLVGVALTHTQVVTGAPLQLTRLFTPLSLPLTRATVAGFSTLVLLTRQYFTAG